MSTDKEYKPFGQGKLLKKRPSLLGNVLEKSKKTESSCSLEIDTVRFPCIDFDWRTKKPGTARNYNRMTSLVMNFPKMDAASVEESLSVTSTETSVGGCFLSSGVKAEDLCNRNIVGPSVCQTSFEVPLSVKSDHYYLIDKTDNEETKALTNWSKWMEVRRRQNGVFSEKLKRDKCDLVMNRHENLRKKIEEKTLLMHVQIPEEDKWRGHPKFWTEPVKLPQKGMKNKYYARKTLMEKGVIPTFEAISVPNVIKMEKDVFRENSNRGDLWDSSKYRLIQRAKYARKIEKLVPHEPEGDKLAVIGQRMTTSVLDTSAEKTDVPQIVITSEEQEQEGMAESVAALIINGVELYLSGSHEMFSSGGSPVWSLIFDAAPVGTITQKPLTVENKGTMAIRYDWLYNSTETPVLPPRKFNERSFFFNKNSGVFIPGQKYDLMFYHFSKNPGFHSETWCLKLWPNLFAEGEMGRIRLTAVAENVLSLQDLLMIDNYLSRCVRDSVVKSTLDELFDRAGRYVPKSLEYPSLFTEEELFEFQNPAHYYRYDIVDQLKSMFKEIPLDQPQEWDFNLFTLEELVRTHVTYHPQRDMLCRLMKLTRALLRPERGNYKTDKKRKMLYNALCSVIDEMEANALFIRKTFLQFDERDSQTLFQEDLAYNPVESNTFGSEVNSEAATEEYSINDASNLGFRLGYSHVAYYQYSLYNMFFHYMSEAAEMAAGIIETCKLFEHHGELMLTENVRFMLEQCHKINEK